MSLLVKVIHHREWGLDFGVTVVSNGGTMDVEELGQLEGLTFPVWFKHDSIANIIAMHDLIREWPITIDPDVEFSIRMHCHDGLLHRFVEVGGGLYAHDLDNANHKIITTPCLSKP